MSDSKLKCGVAGVGYLGQHHARLYREIEGVELAGIFETNEERAREIGGIYQCPVFSSLPELAKECDAVSVVVPTDKHFEVSIPLLEAGCHLLIEKPICAIFLGGQNRNYRFDMSVVKVLADQVDKIIKNNDIQLYILFSRRTDQFIIEYLKERFLDQNIIWNGEGNPYLALMKFSKYLICTSDSVSIISESISSTKPVYIFKLPSLKKNNRIEKFITMLLQKNYARLLGEKLEDFTNSYENETFQVARMIEERYNKKA